MKAYRVKNWEKHFENNRTKELKKLTWVPFPNKHDGDGYTELLDHKNGAAHYGAWCALVQVASKCDVRGTLLRDTGMPYDAITLSRVTRIPENVWSEAIERLINIGWLEVYDNPASGCDNPASGCGDLALSCGLPEGNGREGKGIEKERFTPPTLEEVKQYILAKGYTFDPEKFVAHYSSNGWRVGKNKMKSWHHACQTWHLNSRSFGPNASASSSKPWDGAI